jgi:hypothetical protein
MSSLSLQSEYTVSENVSLISNSLNISNLLNNNTNTTITKIPDSNSQIVENKKENNKIYFRKISNYNIIKAFPSLGRYISIIIIKILSKYVITSFIYSFNQLQRRFNIKNRFN